MIKIDHISFSYGEENENTGGVRDIDQPVNQAGNRGLSTPAFTAEDNKLTIFYI